MSPSLGSKQGEQCTDIFEWRFSNRLNFDIMQVIAANNDRPLHLGGDHHPLEDLAADAHVARERALLVDEVSVFCLLRGGEGQAHVSPIPHGTLSGLLAQKPLRSDEDRILLLESFLVLIHVSYRRATRALVK